jgi:hypothetical protein
LMKCTDIFRVIYPSGPTKDWTRVS